jgi:outer membrane receptor protein involved in Fe transport
MFKMSHYIASVLGIIILYCFNLQAQTTGKIAGRIIESETGDPMAGANIIIEGTSQGAAADIDGTFFILNVKPGVYNVSIQMIGYETVRIENLRVSVNRTATIDIALKPELLESEAIVVQADKIATRKDQTGSISTVSSEQMEVLPIESVGDVVSMQAGVVNGHFRGGRINEVTYLIDGLQVDDAFGGEGRNVDLEPESVQELEVIKGNFNAEYGRAMSGVVNAVTKDGGPSLQANALVAVANYYTSRDNIFMGLDNTEFNRNEDYRIQFSGPILRNQLQYFINTRYQKNNNHLNGIRRFREDDFSDFTAGEANGFSIFQPSNVWGYSEATGDGSYVAMNNSVNLSFLGKLTYQMFNTLRMSFMYTRNDDEWHGYNHAFKYAPDGRNTSYRETDMYIFQMNHMISNSAFYELKLQYLDNYDGWYKFKNPQDKGYMHDAYLGNNDLTGFYTGGQEKGHSETFQTDLNAKIDLTWQVSAKHSLKGGILYTYHDLENRWHEIRNRFEGQVIEGEWYFNEFGQVVYPNYDPVIFPDSSIYTDIYHVKPLEYSAYIQDKMEYEDMVINLGLRFDYFDPKTVYPSQRRNPANQLNFPDDKTKISSYPKADPKYQISPRLSLAYQLGTKALLRFSYGHFFQMPPLYALYENNSFLVAPSDYTTTMGNAQLKAQKTVQYEVGLVQEVMAGLRLDIALYYRDIYDLLSAKVISTFNQIEYGLYSNKDYGNTKGLEISLDYQGGAIAGNINYTLLYTRGNADNPTQTFDRAGSSQDPVNRFIPMSWDQRHTFNATVGYYNPKFGLTLTGYFNSGSPYTWSPIPESLLSRVNLYPNNDYRPSRAQVDFSGYYLFNISDEVALRLTLDMYNMFDALNEVWVNDQTGRAYTAIIRNSDLAGHRSDFNTYLDRVQNPSMYGTPRMIKLGIGINY